MLKQKKVVQKTFRIDYDINEDFETLCEILGRSQNDLVNVAVQELLESNQYWIAKNILVDYAMDFINGFSDYSKFEVENIDVELSWNKNEKVCLKVIHKDKDGKIIQTHKRIFNEFDNDWDYELKKELRNFGTLIDYNSQTIQNYLKEKLNYK